jgi:hypothetical protein
MSDSKFDAALETARNRTQLTHEVTEEGDVFSPQTLDDTSALVEELTATLHPTMTVLEMMVDQPDEDECDGARPRTNARTFVWNVSDDDEMAFEVLGTWTNTYDDKRATVETPAPWDVPDDFDGQAPNDLIKDLPWKDEEADDGTGAYYTFDDDNRAAPSYADEAWTLDAAKLDDLRELAEAEGYEWVDSSDDDNPDEQFEDLLDFVQDGDRIEVTYEKKNGNGLKTYAGEVASFKRVHNTPSTGYDMSTGKTWGVIFEDDSGKTKRVKEGDDGEVSLFSNGRYPFMGEVVTVTVGPSSADFDDAVMYGAEDDSEDDEATDAEAGSNEAAACEPDDDDDDLPDDIAVFAN